MPRTHRRRIRTAAVRAGGKGIPATVAAHPAVFATFTAPSFGPVHARPRPAAHLPRLLCPHGVTLACYRRHGKDDTDIGRPQCPRCALVRRVLTVTKEFVSKPAKWRSGGCGGDVAQVRVGEEGADQSGEFLEAAQRTDGLGAVGVTVEIMFTANLSAAQPPGVQARDVGAASSATFSWSTVCTLLVISSRASRGRGRGTFPTCRRRGEAELISRVGGTRTRAAATPTGFPWVNHGRSPGPRCPVLAKLGRRSRHDRVEFESPGTHDAPPPSRPGARPRRAGPKPVRCVVHGAIRQK